MISRQKERGTDAGPRQGVSPPLFPVKKVKFPFPLCSGACSFDNGTCEVREKGELMQEVVLICVAA